MPRELRNALLASLGFSLAGIFLIGSPDPSSRSAGWAMILLFGGGGIVAVAAHFFRHATRRFHASIPKSISIERREATDVEIAEEWVHSAKAQPLLLVTASKWKEVSEYRWQVSVYLATLARDAKTSGILDPAIYQALKNTKDVADVQREDTEVWAISGAPSGEALVKNVGAALIKCIPKIVPYLNGR